jgi:prepilin-type N-terminal cleavage/methylation domain-containing protein
MFRNRPGASPSGYSLIELVCSMAIAGSLASLAIPGLLANIDALRAIGAARYVTARLQRARTEAVARSADVALQFVSTTSGYVYAVYVDGNGNGVRTADIQQGIDRELMPPERLPALFTGVDFGVLPGLPAVDSGSSAPGTDPIKLGSSNILTFSPIGTASSGSLYILGRRGAQYVVRVSGETGRARVLKFDPGAWRWNPS